MTALPKIACAIAVIALGGATGGAVIGAQIGQAPILQRAGVGGERPSYDFEGDYNRGVAARPNAERPPDRYALETPEGRVEIAELRQRGLYRNRRYSDYDRALAAEDRMWEAEMAALERGDWQPDPRFADREWARAGGTGYERERFGVTVARQAPAPAPAPAYGVPAAREPQSQPQSQPQDRAPVPTPPAIGPEQVQPLDLPAPVTLPLPVARTD